MVHQTKNDNKKNPKGPKMKLLRFKNLLILIIHCFFLTLPACLVPLKNPPIQSETSEIPDINFTQLAEFAQAAAYAYDTDDVIENAYGKKNVIIRELPQSEGKYFIYLDHKNRTQTVSIRGSANKRNALIDIDSFKVYDSHLGIFLHNGFKSAGDDLYSDIKKFLQNDYKTRITGHSLGGALACILMMDLVHDGLVVDQVLTFGQPKVTNEQGGMDYLGVPYFRVINDLDIVAQVPPSNLIYDLSGAYEHFGPEIVLQIDGAWAYSPVHRPTDFITNDNWKNLNLDNVVDHQIKNYIDRIRSIK